MKVGVVGAGFVGSTAAYAMVLEGVASEIVLVDKNLELASAHAEDILHATPYAHATRVRAGGYELLQSSDAVILSCGVGQREGESRRSLLERNARVFEDVVPRVVRAAPDCPLIVASNPVDVITHICARISGSSPDRVIGSGTILDTARFRSLLGGRLGVSSRSVHASVVGEHGDSEVLVWSSAHIGGVPLLECARQTGLPITEEVRAAVDGGVRRAADRIISGKGATYYGIGAGLSRIVRAIRDNEGAVLTVSAIGTGTSPFAGVCFSVPRIVGAQGVVRELWPSLSAEEHRALEASTSVIRQTAGLLGY